MTCSDILCFYPLYPQAQFDFIVDLPCRSRTSGIFPDYNEHCEVPQNLFLSEAVITHLMDN
jgi:hypothetical protein